MLIASSFVILCIVFWTLDNLIIPANEFNFLDNLEWKETPFRTRWIYILIARLHHKWKYEHTIFNYTSNHLILHIHTHKNLFDTKMHKKSKNRAISHDNDFQVRAQLYKCNIVRFLNTFKIVPLSSYSICNYYIELWKTFPF